MKYLQELELEELPAEGRNLLPEFATLSFIKEGRNIVMYGNPGTGKTHIAIGLGIKACMDVKPIVYLRITYQGGPFLKYNLGKICFTTYIPIITCRLSPYYSIGI